MVGLGVYGFRLLTNPVELARKVRAKNVYAPFYELADSDWGRVQMRLLGLIFLVVGILGGVGVVIATLRSTDYMGFR